METKIVDEVCKSISQSLVYTETKSKIVFKFKRPPLGSTGIHGTGSRRGNGLS